MVKSATLSFTTRRLDFTALKHANQRVVLTLANNGFGADGDAIRQSAATRWLPHSDGRRPYPDIALLMRQALLVMEQAD